MNNNMTSQQELIENKEDEKQITDMNNNNNTNIEYKEDISFQSNMLNENAAPILLRELLQLIPLGIQQQSIKNVTLQSSKYIAVRDSKNYVAIIDIATRSVLRLPVRVDSAIMNPISNIVALRAGANLQIYNLDMKSKLKDAEVQNVVFWKWINPRTIAIVTDKSVFHWSMDGNTRPVKMFERAAYFGQVQVLNYSCDTTGKWLLLNGIIKDRIGGGEGVLQVFSVEHKTSQPTIPSHAACIAQVTLDGRVEPANLLCFTRIGQNGNDVLSIIEVDVPHESAFKQSANITFLDADFPVSMIPDNDNGVLFVISKGGVLYVYDIHSGKCIFAQQGVMFTCPHENGGVVAVDKFGRVSHILMNNNMTSQQELIENKEDEKQITDMNNNNNRNNNNMNNTVISQQELKEDEKQITDMNNNNNMNNNNMNNTVISQQELKEDEKQSTDISPPEYNQSFQHPLVQSSFVAILAPPHITNGPRYYISDACMYILVIITVLLILLVSINKPTAIPGFGWSFILMGIFYYYWYRHRYGGVNRQGTELGVELNGRLASFLFLCGFCFAIIVGIAELLLSLSYSTITGTGKDNEDDEDVFSPNQKKNVGFFFYLIFTAYVVAAGCEEALKYFLAVNIKKMHPAITNPRAIVFFAACGPLGFAVVENILYVASQDTIVSAVFLGFIRILVPLHVCTGILIGVGFARKWIHNEIEQKWYRIIFFPIIYHGTYDFLLFLITSYSKQKESDSGLDEESSIGLVIGVMVLSIIILLTHTIWSIRKYATITPESFRRLPTDDEIHPL